MAQMKMTMTAGINNEVTESPKFEKFVNESLGRFLRHDWGDTCAEDSALNDAEPNMALASYTKEGMRKIWIKADDYGKFTLVTVLFPDEY